MKNYFRTFVIIFIMMISSAAAGVPWLGLSFKPGPNASDGSVSLRVEQVFPGSGAFKAGIQPGDLVVSLNGKRFKSVNEMTQYIRQRRTGETMKTKVERSGKGRDLSVVLGERPESLEDFTQSFIGTLLPWRESVIYANGGEVMAAPRLTLVDFWATWCGPCRQGIAHLNEEWAWFKKNKVQVVGLSSETFNELKAFQKSFPLSYPLAQDPGGVIFGRFSVTALPTLMLLDEKGYILKVYSGLVSPQVLRNDVQKYLGNP